MKTFGFLIEEQRHALGYTLRSFCLKYKINPRILSKIERDIQLPKMGELLQLIESLKILEGSVEHAELTNAYNSFIPKSEKFELSDLPLFLKPDVTEEEITDLIKVISDSNSPEDKDLFQ